MNREIYSLKSMAGLDSKFLPDYQFEKPIEFNALVNWYMKTYHKSEEIDRYLPRVRDAIEYANKSIMLDKIGVNWEDDLEAQSPETFKSVFCELAKSEGGLEIKDNDVVYVESLRKSLDGNDPVGNTLYETLWLKTFDTIRQKDA